MKRMKPTLTKAIWSNVSVIGGQMSSMIRLSSLWGKKTIGEYCLFVNRCVPKCTPTTHTSISLRRKRAKYRRRRNRGNEQSKAGNSGNATYGICLGK